MPRPPHRRHALISLPDDDAARFRSLLNQSLAAAERKVFQVMGSGNIVNQFTIGGIGSDVQSFTVTTIPEGTAYPVVGKSYEVAVDNILLDRYILVAVELFDGAGVYQHDAVDINFCVTAHDESLSVGVYRLTVGATDWEEVTGLLKVRTCACACC